MKTILKLFFRLHHGASPLGQNTCLRKGHPNDRSTKARMRLNRTSTMDVRMGKFKDIWIRTQSIFDCIVFKLNQKWVQHSSLSSIHLIRKERRHACSAFIPIKIWCRLESASSGTNKSDTASSNRSISISCQHYGIAPHLISPFSTLTQLFLGFSENSPFAKWLLRNLNNSS